MSLPVHLKAGGSQTASFVLPKTFNLGHNVWVLKATGFNRGIGIHTFNTLQELLKLLKEYAAMLGSH